MTKLPPEQACRLVTIITPEQYLLNGLLFGDDGARRGFIFIHGLTASAFSQQEILPPLAGKDTLVLHFSNRGHDKIAYVPKLDERKAQGYESEEIGEAHEVFTDCVDDIQGAVNYLEARGVKDIYLVGHSTGCQKAVYYLCRQSSSSVKGVVLLCPVSDYSVWQKFEEPKALQRAIEEAQKLVRAGKPHELLPPEIWPAEPYDAQRFLSLGTPDSIEEIFTYSQPDKTPKLLQSVRIPVLAVLAEQDEWWDRPAGEVAEWFKKVMGSNLSLSVMPASNHNLMGAGGAVRQSIASWLKSRQ